MTGYNQKALNDYADESGIVIDVIEEQYHDEIDKGLVISQDPEPGTEIEKGGKVKVIISKGKDNRPFKIVPDYITINYDPESRGKPQVVQIYIDDVNRNIDELYEEFVITKKTVKRIELLIAPDSKAIVKIVRDGEVYFEKEYTYPQ